MSEMPKQKLMPVPFQESFAWGFYDSRVKEQGKIRGVVVQDDAGKRVSLCIYADPDAPNGKSMMVFPYGYVYINAKEERFA